MHRRPTFRAAAATLTAALTSVAAGGALTASVPSWVSAPPSSTLATTAFAAAMLRELRRRRKLRPLPRGFAGAGRHWWLRLPCQQLRQRLWVQLWVRRHSRL